MILVPDQICSKIKDKNETLREVFGEKKRGSKIEKSFWFYIKDLIITPNHFLE
jgi:hypothetical protein